MLSALFILLLLFGSPIYIQKCSRLQLEEYIFLTLVYLVLHINYSANVLRVLSNFVNHESESCSIMSDSLQPHGLYSPWNSPGQNTEVGSLSLLQGNLPNLKIESRSPVLQADSLPAKPPGKPVNHSKSVY